MSVEGCGLAASVGEVPDLTLGVVLVGSLGFLNSMACSAGAADEGLSSLCNNQSRNNTANKPLKAVRSKEKNMYEGDVYEASKDNTKRANDSEWQVF